MGSLASVCPLPASVGFIALWGIPVLRNGVVLVLLSAVCRRGAGALVDCRERGGDEGQRSVRLVMMTATVAMLGLIPFLFYGPGSEVQRP